MAKIPGSSIGKSIAIIVGIVGVGIFIVANWTVWNLNASHNRSDNSESQPVRSMAVERKNVTLSPDNEQPTAQTDAESPQKEDDSQQEIASSQTTMMTPEAAQMEDTERNNNDTPPESLTVPTDNVAEQPAEPAESMPSPPVPDNAQVVRVETGMASYYADALHGNPTASGELYDKMKLTAAHREHPFGTRVRVTNPKNGKSVVVRINDRGPHTIKRIIDISGQAAQEIDLVTMGTTEVKLEVLQ